MPFLVLSLLLTAAIPTLTVLAQSTITLDGATSCGEVNGTWDASTSTCTVSNSSGTGYSLAANGILEVPPGVTLMIGNTGGTGIYDNYGTIANDGTITVSNTGELSDGIWDNYGTIANDGTITVSNSGQESTGIVTAGTFTNGGTITVSNTGEDSTGIYPDYGGIFSNDGTITVSNTGEDSKGISNNPDSTIANSADGIIAVSNSGTLSTGVGNYNSDGTIANDGTITVSNTGEDSTGIGNGGTFTNGGTIAVSNSGAGSNGIQNSAFYANDVYEYAGTIANDGTITVSNTGGYGVDNTGTIANPGTIYVCQGATYGTVPTSGNPLLGCPTSSTETSPNWSGYIAFPAGTQLVTAVSGSWTVPDVQWTGPPIVIGGSTFEDSAQWVGIGGWNFQPLIQIGTASDLIEGVTHYYAWYEVITAGDCVYLPGVYCPPQPISSVPISPGDVISASVSQKSPGTWLLMLDDVSNSQESSTMVSFTPAPASVNTAEWVVENACGSFCTMNDFGMVYFGADYSGVSGTNDATIGGVTAPIGAFTNDQITMTIDGTPTGTKLAVPSPLSSDGTSFSVEWAASSISSGTQTMSTTTIEGGTAMVDQTSTTGTTVSISGSSASDGTTVTMTSEVLGTALPPGSQQVNLGSSTFFDVSVSGISDGTARVCITNPAVSSQSVMQYWDPSDLLWVGAGSVVTTPGYLFVPSTICGNIPVSALTGTPVAIGTLPAPTSTASQAAQSTASKSSVAEFPFQVGLALLVMVAVVASYIAIRRTKTTPEDSGGGVRLSRSMRI